MNNIIRQMKLTAKAENARARKAWGTIGGADDFGKYGRSLVLPPKAEKIETLLAEGKSRKDIANVLKISYQGVADYISRYNLGTGK